ncbi:hypothetical protein [Acinetobacter sp. TGL-Y2]|uniref:hypothetical protein n=1 Tax=Acinetobacter sp. TGL-Y2 TaxID=1407071 RepID=UPI00190566E8|nr:hypothetical protein [Acinetobacter sp. TGL-Y2]MBJ9372516.1 hypothetical protein [Acinetobacter sp. TGL-Y2]
MEIPAKKISTARTSTKENNIEHIKITRKKQLFLLFYADESSDEIARRIFKEAVQTRLVIIKTDPMFDPDIHMVHCPNITHFSQIQVIIDFWKKKYGGQGKVEMKEVSFFSHAGLNGPIIYDAWSFDPLEILLPVSRTSLLGTQKRNQLIHSEWAKFNYYWGKDTRLNFFGCNSAYEKKGKNNFAKKISTNLNCINVLVAGQSLSSYPSFLPDKRKISKKIATLGMSLYYDDNPIYMVACLPKQGWDAMLKEGTSALPMNFYKNGMPVATNYQSIFNDHRQPRNNINNAELSMVNKWIENAKNE